MVSYKDPTLPESQKGTAQGGDWLLVNNAILPAWTCQSGYYWMHFYLFASMEEKEEASVSVFLCTH